MNKAQQSLAFYWSLIILDALTFLLNFLTCIMFVRFRKRLLASTHNRILFSMALADALVGIFGTSLGVLLLLKQTSLYYKIAGNIPMFSSLFISVLSLVLLTVDRLVAVKVPFKYTSAGYRRLINKLLIASWIIPAIITIQQSLIFVYDSSKQELVVRSILFSVFFVIGTFALIISNSTLIFGIRRYFSKVDTRLHSRPSASAPPASKSVYELEDQSVASEVIREDRPIAKVELSIVNEEKVSKPDKTQGRRGTTSRRSELKQTSLFCLLIVTLFLTLWMPLAVYRVCYAAGKSLNIAWLRRLALCLSVINSLLNPVMYFLVKKELRKYMRRMFNFNCLN